MIYLMYLLNVLTFMNQDFLTKWQHGMWPTLPYIFLQLEAVTDNSLFEDVKLNLTEDHVTLSLCNFTCCSCRPRSVCHKIIFIYGVHHNSWWLSLCLASKSSSSFGIVVSLFSPNINQFLTACWKLICFLCLECQLILFTK